MSQFGWGVVTKILQDQEGVVPAYRWDKEGSSYYSLRPDRWFPDVVQAYRLTTYSGFLEFQSRFHVANPRGSSRGGGGPSALTQYPPSSSDSRQARASAQGGKSGGARHRRESCPKGYYWSYREKKCMKSKFR